MGGKRSKILGEGFGCNVKVAGGGQKRQNRARRQGLSDFFVRERSSHWPASGAGNLISFAAYYQVTASAVVSMVGMMEGPLCFGSGSG